MFVKMEFEELCKCDIVTNILNPSLDPLTIKINISNKFIDD